MIDRRWLALHCHAYWHYDVLQALLVLSGWARPAIRAPATPSTCWCGAAR